ncbi:MAG TPA: phosphoribosyltransferase [Peptococcaceae bacterium]|nr:MAG: Phosphoribosyltransferase [Clostridia bacterium 41_269]HBT19811.1 phosphoribosyltransferase [Peptococcaceae bacterium]
MVFFANRQDAGKKLAVKLEGLNNDDVVVVAIPRGGVVVAEPVAEKLKAPLDVVVPRKIGMPGNPELAVGALSPDGSIVLNHRLLWWYGLDEEELKPIIEKELGEIKRRMELYRQGRKPFDVRGKHAIIIDDGIATGYTMYAAVEFLKKQGAEEITAAVPVAPSDTAEELSKRVHRAVILHIPEVFYSVGQFYGNFDQLTDEEVVNILEKWK